MYREGSINHCYSSPHVFVGSEQYSDGSDKWVSELVRIDPFEHTMCGASLDEYEVMHGLPLFTKDLHDLHEHTSVCRLIFLGAESAKTVV